MIMESRRRRDGCLRLRLCFSLPDIGCNAMTSVIHRLKWDVFHFSIVKVLECGCILEKLPEIF